MKHRLTSRAHSLGARLTQTDDERFIPPVRASDGIGARKRAHSPVDMGLDRKAIQLCHQVAETLDSVLADCGDAVLQGLRVLDVEPSPDASRLLVTVAVDEIPDGLGRNLDGIHQHLSRASGHLRSEVASAITRKRAPTLVYRLLPAIYES